MKAGPSTDVRVRSISRRADHCADHVDLELVGLNLVFRLLSRFLGPPAESTAVERPLMYYIDGDTPGNQYLPPSRIHFPRLKPKFVSLAPTGS